MRIIMVTKETNIMPKITSDQYKGVIYATVEFGTIA